jgi:hypothetical protein
MKKEIKHKGKPLNQEEVNNLSKGTKVVITWTGGNGPHLYEIHKRDDGLSYVKEHNPNAGWWDGEIDFVGPEKPHTIVTLDN